MSDTAIRRAFVAPLSKPEKDARGRAVWDAAFAAAFVASFERHFEQTRPRDGNYTGWWDRALQIGHEEAAAEVADRVLSWWWAAIRGDV